MKNLAKLTNLATRCRQMVHRPENRATDPWYRIVNADDGERAEMWIYGVIGSDWDPDDVTAGQFARDLRAITAPAMDLHINSPGGLIFDGVAIYTALLNHPATVDVLVEGVAASAASFVSMAGDSIAIEKPAKMMIHDAQGFTLGGPAEHQQQLDLLNELSDTIAEIYADRAGGATEEWRERMRAETWFSSAQAVAAGLADRVNNDTGGKPANTMPRGGYPAPRANVADLPKPPPGPGPGATRNQINTTKGAGMSIEEILAAMKAITDAAEGRNMTDEEVKRYEGLENKLATLRTNQIRDRQAAYEAPAPENAQIQAAVHVAPPREDNTLDKAFAHYLRTGKQNADLEQLRNAQSSGTGSEGGYLVPDGFRQKIVDRMKAFGGIANVVEEITTETGQPLPWVTLDDTGNSGEIVAEGGTFSGGADLVFGSASLGAYSYMAGGAGGLPMRVPLELLQDAAFDVEGLVSDKLGMRLARIQATHLVTGNGVSEPQGIVDGLTGVEPNATAVVYADFITWIHSVDPAYRGNGRWAFNDASLAMIRKILDGNNRPILQPSADGSAAGTPGGELLLGYPVTIDQGFSSYVGTSGAGTNWGVFGDLREGYVTRRVRSIEILVNPYSRMANRQVEFTAWARMDAVQQNTNAYVAMAGFTA